MKGPCEGVRLPTRPRRAPTAPPSQLPREQPGTHARTRGGGEGTASASDRHMCAHYESMKTARHQARLLPRLKSP